SVQQPIATSTSAINKMTVRVDEPKIRYSGTFGWFDDDSDGGWDITDDSLRLSHVRMRVTKSPDSFYHVTLYKQAYGSTRAEARQRAERFTYTASSLDSALILSSGFGVGKEQKYRAQQVLVQIEVPTGRMIRFDESIEKLEMSEIKLERSGNWRRDRWEMDWDESFYDWEPGVDYIMSDNGNLVRAIDGVRTDAPSVDSGYRYRRDTTINNQQEINRQIEEQRRRVQEEEERLRQLQQQQREERTTRIKERNKLKQTLAAQLPSPVLSLLI
ncbi:MAG: hypothetical protein ACO1NX_00895, partial [Chitinophagaceae bacterium]